MDEGCQIVLVLFHSWGFGTSEAAADLVSDHNVRRLMFLWVIKCKFSLKALVYNTHF